MNLYHKKQRWKIALMGFATLLVAASLWFSFGIVSKVQDREVDRIQQWANAVERKSELVKLTNQTFDELRTALMQLKERDRQKVELWSMAIAEINKPLDDYSLVLNILQSNKEIPLILTDMGENVVSSHNLENLDSAIMREIHADFDAGTIKKEQFDERFKRMKNDSLRRFISFWRRDHEPLEIHLYEGVKQKVFYFDSIYYKTQKLKALELRGDSLLESFSNELITNEYLVPVMFIDKSSREVIGTNMAGYDSANPSALIDRMVLENDSIVVDLGSNAQGVIYYEHSPELTQMKYFPFVQFLIIGLFILIAYLGFSTFRKAEQDQVWVGMAKETAHQLGTPISSLMAWNEILESQGVDKSITSEIDTDIERLSKVTDRFSKIGSASVLHEENVVDVLRGAMDYLRKRISDKVDFSFNPDREEIYALLNPSLLEWVVENLVKNAVDAMDGSGSVAVSIHQKEEDVIIDIADTGKGIPPNKIKTVFQPGYTTKQRGWGLGLSLVKRIIEDFHKGKVYVLKSEVNSGTTFRVVLRA